MFDIKQCLGLAEILSNLRKKFFFQILMVSATSMLDNELWNVLLVSFSSLINIFETFSNNC